MKVKRLFWLIFSGVLIGTGLITIIQCESKAQDTTYQFAEITRGDIVNTVSCSGTLEAVGTVEVGTQVSGVLNKIYVDFNDKVRKNQVLAVLDTVLLKAQVMEARANYEKAEAQLQEAKADYDRNLPLFQKGLISEADYLPSKINLKIQEASVKSSQAAVIRADRNLKFAVIRSPIDGTVIQRSVEEGQTVAASLQAPTLFIIAEDLSKMEIHAQVDESDIGQIKNGQKAVFEVQAYPDKQFEGVIRQVRLQPEVVQNVVNYTVVVDADNKDDLLLPGMTATIDFYVEEVKDILMVPNTALRFRPSLEYMTEYREKMRSKRMEHPDSTGNQRFNSLPAGGQPGFNGGFNGARNMPEDMGTVWFVNDEGSLEMAPFRMGKTDGKNTEILKSRKLKEGMKVVIGTTDPTQSAEAQNGQNSGRRFGPRLF